MYYKNCPFCNHSVKERYETETQEYIIECNHCSKKGIIVNAKSKSIEELQTLWNDRKKSDDIYENVDNKEDYGYLIMPNAEIIKCDDSHPEELLAYLGIFNDYTDFDYETMCRNLGILRISNHCSCIMIDVPKKINKKQINECIEIIKDYQSANQFNIYVNNSMLSLNNVSECILELDRIK